KALSDYGGNNGREHAAHISAEIHEPASGADLLTTHVNRGGPERTFGSHRAADRQREQRNREENAQAAGSDVEQHSTSCHSADGHDARAATRPKTRPHPVGNPAAERRHHRHSDEDDGGRVGALLLRHVPDLAEVVINPVVENVLEVVQREIRAGEQQEVTVTDERTPGCSGLSSGLTHRGNLAGRAVAYRRVPDRNEDRGKRSRDPKSAAPAIRRNEPGEEYRSHSRPYSGTAHDDGLHARLPAWWN